MTTDRNHEMSADEVRRALRDSQAEHEAALPGWRRTLDRLFDPASGASGDDKAAFLGVPNRRAFMMGGAALAGSAVLAACGKKKKTSQTPLTGEVPAVPSTTTTTAPGSAANDKVLLQTAQSIEVLAVQTYKKALDSGLITDQAVKDVATLFQSQHQDHADALDDAVKAAGGKPVTSPNQYLLDSTLQKEIDALTDQQSVLVLARELENIAAQTYTQAGGVLTTPQLRQTAMTIGDTEARHITVLNLALGYAPVPLSFMPTRLAIDPKGYVGA